MLVQSGLLVLLSRELKFEGNLSILSISVLGTKLGGISKFKKS